MVIQEPLVLAALGDGVALNLWYKDYVQVAGSWEGVIAAFERMVAGTWSVGLEGCARKCVLYGRTRPECGRPP